MLYNISPFWGCNNPSNTSRSVVLPAPEGPIIPIDSPMFIDSDISFRAQSSAFGYL